LTTDAKSLQVLGFALKNPTNRMAGRMIIWTKSLQVMANISDLPVVQVYDPLDLYIFAGNYENREQNVTNIFVGVFNIKANITEWVKYIAEPVQMTAVDVLLAADENLVAVGGNMKGNTLKDMEIMLPTASHVRTDEINVFVYCFARTGGILQWTHILGDAEGDDLLTKLQYWDGRFYAVYDSTQAFYSTLPVKHVQLTVFLLETGEFLDKIVIGGPSPTLSLDANVNHQGIFILMNYSSGLQPHATHTQAWATPNSSAVCSGLIWLTFNLRVADLEIMNVTSVNTPSPSRFLTVIDNLTYLNRFIAVAQGSYVDAQNIYAYETLPRLLFAPCNLPRHFLTDT
jgi:hypothetical protein